ncbi:hypothetical protein Hdeb2414_s0008g00296181 [Helianthus debilis subsp. tardiflorus]
MIRIDYAPCGLTSPHTHPRATEILTVIEGTLQVGFVTSNPHNRLSPRCCKRVMFSCSLWPVGLVHFQRNVGNGYAVTGMQWLLLD